jgi:hypothetical protein
MKKEISERLEQQPCTGRCRTIDVKFLFARIAEGSERIYAGIARRCWRRDGGFIRSAERKNWWRTRYKNALLRVADGDSIIRLLA